MCDTLFINKGANRYFLKNSDRSPNEPNLLVNIPHKIHDEKTLKCTYIEIPQVKETYGCFLVKPSWMWGAEMGVNEFNVAIGNEAVFTKSTNKKETLIGMDYLRLALERAKSAKEALEVITSLLKVYGQGGNCGYDHKFYYNNSYLIADKSECYVLETVGKDYAYKKIEGSYNISNRLSLNTNYDYATKEYKKGFAKTNSDFFFSTFSCSKQRELMGEALIENSKDDLLDMIEILSNTRNKDTLYKGDVGSICMVKTLTGDHSTGSMIVNLAYDNPTIWVSGGSLPVNALYKPIYLSSNIDLLDNDEKKVQYYFNRAITDRAIISKLIDKTNYDVIKEKLQKEFIDKEKKLRNNLATEKEFNDFSIESFKTENEFILKNEKKLKDILSKNVKLKGLQGKLVDNISINPFSNSLVERLKH